MKVKNNILNVSLMLIIISIVFSFIAISNAVDENEVSVSYFTHIQDIGWEREYSKQNGDTSGTEGASKRLEAIKIKVENLSENAKIKYQVHVQNIGWQSWKENGEMAGTSGKGLRLEGIRIKLENEERYSIEYRVHVQNIGWQEWKQDGAMAGTTGKGLRLEAIQIRLINKETKGKIVIEKGLTNESYFDEINISGYKFSNVKDTKLKVLVDNVDFTEKVDVDYQARNDLVEKINYGSEEENSKPGFKFTINTKELQAGSHNLKVQLLTQDESKLLDIYNKDFLTDKDIHIFYKSHIQDIGWQGYVKDGNVSGTTGKGLRVEAMNIKAINLPENVNLKYQVHVQDIGWQAWKNQDELAGTTGASKRIEAIRIKLENEEEYSIEYRVHVQNIGWQKWKQDGAVAGTIGEAKRIEAIQIRIVPKENKGLITVESNTDSSFYEEISVKGWKMTNVKNTKLKVYLDDNEITSNANIEYEERKDLLTKIDYGSEEENTKPGFEFNISTSSLETGNYNLKIELVSDDESTLLDTWTKEIKVDKNIHIEYQAHVQDIGWQAWSLDGAVAGTTGASKRIEALKIKAHNLPEGVKLKYQAHVQGIGWQTWKNDGEIAGTTGDSRSIEGIRIELESTDKYSIIYKAHVQDIGWQAWGNDGEMEGTTGIAKRIEAIQIKVVDKITEERTQVYVYDRGTLTNETHNVNGYLMTNVSNVSLKLFIDDNEIKETLNRTASQDVYNSVKGYGGDKLNPKPRWDVNIDFSKYSLGNHTIKIQAVSQSGDVITEHNRNVNIVKKIEHYKATYGYTGLGDVLEYFRYGNGSNVFFATFCVHGFEDNWNKDGYELVDIAHQFYNKLVSMNDYAIADKWTIYIMQCVNPDGVNSGYTNNGPGRTTLRSDVGTGIDLNRCWSTNFSASYSARNYTGPSPFLAVESRFLRDFMLAHKSNGGQNVVVDLHGWTQQLIGDSVLRNYYRNQFPENTDTATYGKGYLINWARENLGARAALIELPSNTRSHADVVNQNLANRYMEATLSMLRGL